MNLKTIWTFLSNPFTLLAIIVILGYSEVRLTQSYNKKIEIDQKNFQAVVSDKDIQIDITKRQLSTYYPALINLAKENKIKVNTINNIIQTQYIIKDSIIHQDSIIYMYKKDTINKTIDFIAHKDCFTIYGQGKDSTTKITKVDFKDDLTTFIYRAYDHHFLFFKWGEYIRAKEYSECQKDTVHISGNIRVQ